MTNEKKYYLGLDILRIVSCLAVLLYHLDILKGGYLAVCTFFVLSGYLSCIKAFRKEKMNLLSYYKNRFIHIYVPLCIVVFLTIFLVSQTDVTWLNLKPETSSVIFGYNNFWQLSANLDYFTKSMSSPFMHFWYIGILLQFDLVFPFIYMLFKKIGDKVHKIAACEILALLSIIGAIYFYRASETENIMFVYYDTFTRCFSLLFGVTLGFIHKYYGALIPKIFKNKASIFFIFYLLILIAMFFMIDAGSNYFNIAMIISSLATVRLIDYGIYAFKNAKNISKIFKISSSITYEVYLLQYPVIYLIDVYAIENIRILIIITLTIISAIILHFALSSKNMKKPLLVVKYLSLIIILALSILGFKDYVFAKDNSEEMRALEKQLSQNEEMLKKKQEEYLLKKQQEEDSWTSMLNDLENGEEKLKDIVTNLPVVGIGDSVLLGAAPTLYTTFPNGYFDGKVSRTDYELNPILVDLKNKGMLGDVVVINLGTNGDCKMTCKPQIISTLKGKKVFWVNVVNDYQVHVNSRIEKIASDNDNIYLVDWVSASKGHKEYFASDGIHLTGSGRNAYSKTIYDAIYNVYLDEYNKKKEEIIKEHDEKEKKKITFIGNDILVNAFNILSSSFENAKFITNSNYTFDMIKEDIKNGTMDGSITHKVVLAFDKSLKLSKEKYNELIDLLGERDIYIILLDSSIKDIENANVLNFYDIINENPDYLMVDKIHLNDKGNNAIEKLLSDTLNVRVMDANS